MNALFTLSAWIEVVTVVAVIVFVLSTLIPLSNFLINKHRVKQRQKEGYTEEHHYFGPLRKRGVPEEMAHYLLAWFREWHFKDFPVKADDIITQIYGIEAEDQEDMMEELAYICGRVLDIEHVDLSQITTIEDLAIFLTRLPPVGQDERPFIMPDA